MVVLERNTSSQLLADFKSLDFTLLRKVELLLWICFYRWERGTLDAHRRRLRRNSLHLSWISILYWRNRTRQLVCLQPIQVDDGAFRLLRHVVIAINIFLTKKQSQSQIKFCFNLNKRNVITLKSWTPQYFLTNRKYICSVYINLS